jgi:hypothetical protein
MRCGKNIKGKRMLRIFTNTEYIVVGGILAVLIGTYISGLF